MKICEVDLRLKTVACSGSLKIIAHANDIELECLSFLMPP